MRWERKIPVTMLHNIQSLCLKMDSSFQINRVIMDDDNYSITKADAILSAILNSVGQRKITYNIRKTTYTKIFEELLVMDNILVKGERLVIPGKLINCTIEISHQSSGLGKLKTIQYLKTKV